MSRTPAALEWREISLRLGGFALVQVSLRIEPGSWITLVGPTGAGKSLLCEVAVGFLDPDCGRVFRRGVDVTAFPPEDRELAYVPQDDLLFPHLDVRGNLSFGARRRASEEVASELLRLAVDLGIEHLLDRGVRGLSGGEAQRVAIGRALLSGADTILLDECTSALDADTKQIVGDLLGQHRRERGLSVLQISHDLEEARRLADEVRELEAGQLRPSSGRPPSIRDRAFGLIDMP